MIQFQGDLELISFSDVLQFLSGGRKSGALVVERPDGMTRQVFFDKGEIIASSSSRPEDYLGQILVRRGAVAAAEVQAALEDKPQGMRLGAALVAKGLISDDEVQHFLTEQFKRIIFDTFHWTKGTFRFMSGARPEGGRVHQSFSVDSFVLEGLRRLDEGRIIDRRIPSEDVPLIAIADPPPTLKLSTVEREVHKRLRDSATRADLLRVLRCDEFDLRKSIYKLYEAGLVGPWTEADDGDPASAQRIAEELLGMVATYNGIFSLIYQSVRLESDDDVEPPALTFVRSRGAESPVFRGVAIQQDGTVEAASILGNLVEVPAARRRRALAESLSQLLSFQLGVVRERVGAEVATGILEMCSTLLR